MSSRGNQSTSGAGSGNQAPQNSTNVSYPSKSEMLKGYGGMKNFMLSYGLKLHEDDDLEEAKAILDKLMEVEYESRLQAAKEQPSH